MSGVLKFGGHALRLNGSSALAIRKANMFEISGMYDHIIYTKYFNAELGCFSPKAVPGERIFTCSRGANHSLTQNTIVWLTKIEFNADYVHFAGWRGETIYEYIDTGKLDFPTATNLVYHCAGRANAQGYSTINVNRFGMTLPENVIGYLEVFVPDASINDSTALPGFAYGHSVTISKAPCLSEIVAMKYGDTVDYTIKYGTYDTYSAVYHELNNVNGTESNIEQFGISI